MVFGGVRGGVLSWWCVVRCVWRDGSHLGVWCDGRGRP